VDKGAILKAMPAGADHHDVGHHMAPCHGRLTAHLHGQMSCTNADCSLDAEAHGGPLVACRICFGAGEVARPSLLDPQLRTAS